jgi:hypothetical protein
MNGLSNFAAETLTIADVFDGRLRAPLLCHDPHVGCEPAVAPAQP